MNSNVGAIRSPVFAVAVVLLLLTLSDVATFAVTSAASRTARSLIVTAPVFVSIVTPSIEGLSNVQLLPFFVAVTVCCAPLPFVYVKLNVFTFLWLVCETITSPFS